MPENIRQHDDKSRATVTRCKHGLLPGQCAMCLGQVDRFNQVRIYGGISKYKARYLKKTSLATTLKEDLKMEIPESLRKCTNCGLTKPLSDFSKNHTCMAGHEGQCKECKNKKAKLRNQNRKQIAKLSIPPKKIKKNRNTSHDVKPLTIDFEGYPEVMQSLKDAAHKHIRTIEKQVVAYVVMGLQKDGMDTCKDSAPA